MKLSDDVSDDGMNASIISTSANICAAMQADARSPPRVAAQAIWPSVPSASTSAAPAILPNNSGEGAGSFKMADKSRSAESESVCMTTGQPCANSCPDVG
mmetsp:Transcript_28469/g.85326  ORF Transcript_28469/g.85326 Transcript_28469/m.85326 type:complete len:100 (-) Transcript_28469:314-613(-)